MVASNGIRLLSNPEGILYLEELKGRILEYDLGREYEKKQILGRRLSPA